MTELSQVKSKTHCAVVDGTMAEADRSSCPQCKGKGNLSVESSTIGSDGAVVELPAVELTCPTCNGAGKISREEQEWYDAEVAAWCHCGNPSEDRVFYSDGEHACGKHCWCCKDCGKLLQVG